MQEGLTFFDIIFLVILAAFIYTRFFGHKLPKNKSGKKSAEILSFPKDTQGVEQKAPPKPKKPKISSKKLAELEGMDQIKAVDRQFNEKEFLKGAEHAFGMYYDAYGKKDEDTLEQLLGARLFDEVMDKLDDLEKEGLTPGATCKNVESTEIVDARVSGKAMIIDVKYVAETSEFALDESGKVKQGRKTPKTQTQIWTWARPIDSDDPNWQLEKITMPS